MTLEVLSELPKRARAVRPLLFVHGAYVAAWCWAEHFLPWFAARGYAAHAVSLRGHGGSDGRERLDESSLDDYVQDVLEAAGAIVPAPVLIGHSMGALLVQRAARRAKAPAMVLMAPVPPHGIAASAFSLALRDPPLLMALNAMQHGGASAPALRRMRDYLFSASVSEADVSGYLRRAQRESQRALLDLAWPQHLFINSSVGVPALVLGAAGDAFFTAPMIDEAARFHGVEARIFPDMAHAMMLEPGWRDVAARIHAWLQTCEAARA